MQTKRKAYFQMHIAVFLFGFTAILGELISLSELPLVWWRIAITCLSLLFFPSVLKSIRSVKKSDLLFMAFVGCIVAAHWVLFYGSIKYSKVSVTLSCMATGSFFTAILEPLMLKTKFKWYELSLGLLVIPGMYLVVFYTSVYITGILMGIASAILAVLFSILNKKLVDRVEPYTLTFTELGSGLIFLSIILPFYLMIFGTDVQLIPNQYMDWIYLLILALLCTTFAYVLALKALKRLTPFITNLSINLEPVYGILLAFLFFREDKDLHPRFYIGVAIILLAVFLHPFLKRIFEPKEA